MKITDWDQIFLRWFQSGSGPESFKTTEPLCSAGAPPHVSVILDAVHRDLKDGWAPLEAPGALGALVLNLLDLNLLVLNLLDPAGTPEDAEGHGRI